MKDNIAIVFAGGTGTRMKNKGVPKQFLELNNKPIIIYTLEKFENCKEIDAIAVVCIASWIDYLKKMLKRFDITKVKWIIKGGSTAHESTLNGLETVAKDVDPQKTIVLIHDGVRPLIDDKLIRANIEAVKKYGNAITSVPAIETVVITRDKTNIDDVVNRNVCFMARAPQSFILSDILKYNWLAKQENYTGMVDSASLMLHYGNKLHLVEGSTENIKITNPIDFYVFKAIVEAKENKDVWGV